MTELFYLLFMYRIQREEIFLGTKLPILLITPLTVEETRDSKAKTSLLLLILQNLHPFFLETNFKKKNPSTHQCYLAFSLIKISYELLRKYEVLVQSLIHPS